MLKNDPDDSDVFVVDDDWEVGFEIEIHVGSMGIPKWETLVDSGDALDEATPEFCRDVAKRLTALTGRPFKAPRNGWRRGLFAVVPEYDLDPLSFSEDICAGVEVITPPLPFTEAEQLLRLIGKACREIGAQVDDTCGLHINVSRRRDTRSFDFTVWNYVFSVDEEAVLIRNGRFESEHARPQLDAVTPAILAHLREDPTGSILSRSVDQTIHGMAGYGKRFAANFDKLDRGYIELRFWNGESLENASWELMDLLVLLLAEISNASLGRLFQSGDEFIRKHVEIRRWLDGVAGRLRIGEPVKSKFDVSPELPILLDDRCVGHFGTNRGYEVRPYGANWALSNEACRVPNARLSDWREGFARMVLKDIAFRRAKGKLDGLPEWAAGLAAIV